MNDIVLPSDDGDLRGHAEWVGRLARSLLKGDEGAAQDATQDTLLAAWTHPPEQAPTRPWLARVLRNAIRSRIRSDARRTAREEAMGAADLVDPADVVITRMESQRQVIAAVLALPEAYRRTIALRYYEGLTSDEIAARLGVSPGTIRSRIQRGLAILRKELRVDDERWLRALAALPGGAVPATMANGAGSTVFLGVIVSTKAKAMAAAGVLILGAMWFGAGWQGPPESGIAPPARDGSAEPEPSSAENVVSAPAVVPSREMAAAEPSGQIEESTDDLARMTGRLELADGLAGSGVTVELHAWPRNSKDVARFGKVITWSDQRVTTDTDGRFEFAFDPPPPYQFVVSIEDLRFAAWRERRSAIDPGDLLDLGLIPLSLGATMRGRVSDDDGHPVAGGWSVSAHHLDQRFVAEDRTSGSSDYELSRLAAGAWRIEVRHRDGRTGGPWQVKLSPGQVLDFDLALTGTSRRTIHLRAVVGKQTIRLEPSVVRIDGPEGIESPTIDADSRLRYEPTSEGPYDIIIDDPRFLPWRREGVVPGQMLSARLASTSSVLLHVTGVPEILRDTISVSLRLRPPADLEGWNSNYEPRPVHVEGVAFPDPFVLGEVVAGFDYDLVVHAEGCSDRWVPVIGLQAFERRSVSAALSSGAALGGVVTAANGTTPASEVDVFLYGPDHEKPRQSFLMVPSGKPYSGFSSLRVPLASVRTDMVGRFFFDQLTAGSYTLRARESPSFHTLVDVTLLDDERRESMVVSMPTVHDLRVTLIAPEELASEGVRLVVKYDGSADEAWFGSDPPKTELPGVAVRWNEPLSLKPLPAGTMSLFMEYEKYSIPLRLGSIARVSTKPKAVGEVLLDAPVTHRTIELGDSLPGTLGITLLANGQPLAGATLFLEGGRGAVTDKGGVAPIPPVPPGQYVVCVRAVDSSWTMTLPDAVEVRAGVHTSVTRSIRLATGAVRFKDRAGQPTCEGRFQVRSGWRIGDREQDVVPDAHGVAIMTLPIGTQTFVVNGKEHPVEWAASGPSQAEIRVE